MQVGNRYELKEVLGQGGMGAVYRAYDRIEQQTVALKRMAMPVRDLSFRSKADYEDDTTAIIQEFRTLASLRHPNIISVFDYGLSDGQPFFTMEFIPQAQDFLTAAADKSPVQQVELLIQVLEALRYLHRRDVIHRDLKPDNIMVLSGGQVKLVDFGLSVNASVARGRAGTMAYMAPETLEKSIAVPQSDFYAVGVILYRMLTGELPFASDDIIGMIEKYPDMSIVGDYPASFVLGRLLSKNPADRYLVADECIQALKHAFKIPVQTESEVIRESFLQASQFVGRDAEMQMLKRAQEQVLQGETSFYLIGGESGAGKSRLIDEFRVHALVSGMTVLRGQATENDGGSFRLWQNIVQRLLLIETVDDEQAGILKDIVPDIEVLIGREVATPPGLNDKAHHKRLEEAIVTLIQQTKKPLLLLLDDLHLAKDALNVLQQLLDRRDELAQLMVIGTYRHDEASLLRHTLPATQFVQLERLSLDSIRELSISMLGANGARAEVVSLLENQTEGNIFFVVETVRALAEEAGSLNEIGKKTLPEQILTRSMRDLMARRLQKVDEPFQAIQQLAAIIGRNIDLNLLEYHYLQRNIEGWLINASQHMVLEVQENQWRFSHDKLRDAIVYELDENERGRLHRAAAEAIEAVYPDNPDYNDILLHHWSVAGDIDKELTYLKPVAEQEANVYGNYARVYELVERGLSLMDENDPRCLPLHNIQLTAYVNQGDFEHAKTVAHRVYHLAEQFENHREMGNSLNVIGVIASMQGDTVEGITYFERSLHHRTLLGDKRGMGLSLMNLGITAKNSNRYSQAQAYYQQAIGLFQELDDVNNLALVYHNLGTLNVIQRQYAEATHNLEQAFAIAETQGNIRLQGQTQGTLSDVALRQANFEAAEHYIQRSIAFYQQIEDTVGITHGTAALGLIYSFQNDERACSVLVESLEQTHRLQMTPFIIELFVGFINLYIQQARFDKATNLLHIVLHHPSRRPEADGLAELIKERIQHERSLDDLQSSGYAVDELDLEDVIQELLDEFAPVKSD